METKEGNKLIAEFMRYDYDENANFAAVVWGEPMRNIMNSLPEYHTSWDWLMPVLKKIDKLNPSGEHFKEYEEWWDLIDNSVTQNYEINDVLPFVVKFIQWYNTLTK